MYSPTSAPREAEVHVITNASPHVATLNREEFVIHAVPVKRGVETYEFFPNLRFFWIAGGLLPRLHSTVQFDCVQLAGSLPVLSLYVSLLARIAGCQCVWVFLSFVPGQKELTALPLMLRDRPFWYQLFLSRTAFRLLARIWCCWLDGVIVGSKTALSLLRDVGVVGTKLFLIPPGVDLEVFRPRPPTERSWLRILYVSTCYPWKGTLDLLEAFRLVIARGLRAELVYVFSQARSDSKTSEAAIRRLERRIGEMGLQDKVIIRDGPVPDIETVIGGAGILVCPLQSGIGTLDIPMSIVEAMACGLPVVGTGVASVREAILDGVNGYVVAPKSPETLAQAIAKLPQDPPAMRRMGEEGRRLAEQFDVRRTAQLLREMYSTLSGRSGSQPEPPLHPRGGGPT